MESSDSECKFGKRWIMRAVMGMFGMSIVAWAVEVSISPFGMATSMVESSVFAVWFCKVIACCWKKWPVLPVSAIVLTIEEEGGPSRGEKLGLFATFFI